MSHARALVVAVVMVTVPDVADAGHSASVGAEVARLLDQDDGYRAVVSDMLRWHRTRRRGCVAFVTSALRQVGFEVPDERPAGPWSNPARVTFSLDAYLADRGWLRVANPGQLVAGDVVFTEGAPDHVMVFHGWADRGGAVALVSDNRRHRYRRPLRPAAGDEQSGFAFARRAPPDLLASVDLDDSAPCQDVTALRRKAGTGYLSRPGEVACRALDGARGAVALVAQAGPDTELSERHRIILLDGRGRLRARADLAAGIDGYGGGSMPELLGGGDLGRDGRVEVWFENRFFSPMGSTTSSTIHLLQPRGRRLVEIGQAAAGWTETIPDRTERDAAAGEHWEPPLDPARQITCRATISVRADHLAISRQLRRGSAVRGATAPSRCEPATRLAPRR
ncbi:MAG TPA: hypothetical protein VFU21_15715 [Kofleriaceae bacterium]|nr:hypothetical protein [Kofleriaceae bacterium]